MEIQLKCFGQVAEIIGKSELKTYDIADTDSLIKKICTDFPKLDKFTFLISVNKKLIQGNQKLRTGDEVAFLPPFAGG